MKRFIKKIAILLCMVLIAPTIIRCLPSVHNLTQVEAAEKVAKAKLSATKGNIGINSSPEYIPLENEKDTATYTFTSSDKKIVKVDKYGCLTGVATGKAKITLKETYKKKTVNVGTYTIFVKNSNLEDHETTVAAYDSFYPRIRYRNYAAEYSYVSSDSTIIGTDNEGHLIGLKPGEAQVTVSETYNKVTRELGVIAVKVVESSIDADSKTISIGVAVGTTTLTVTEDYKGTTRTVGEVQITVKEIPVTEFDFDPYFKDDAGVCHLYYYKGETIPLTFFIIKTPYDASPPVTFTSNDETIAKVDNNGNITAVGYGTVKITATCDNFTDAAFIIVTEYKY